MLNAMRLTNPLHFTEQHRFYVFRDFALSDFDWKVISQFYQPMVGAVAAALYMTLYHQLDADRIGYSPLEQQRKLFLSMEIDMGERGRRLLIEQTSKLEAVGLLRTVRKYLAAADEHVFGYELQRPLSPPEFFRNEHLTLLLRDKIGKFAVLALKDEYRLVPPEPLAAPGVSTEELSVPFYEQFRLNVCSADPDLSTDDKSDDGQAGRISGESAAMFRYEDILARTPQTSANRRFIEALKRRPDQLAVINMTARKYRLSLQETCRLLDEDGMFTEAGELDTERLTALASLCFHQARKRTQAVERALARGSSSNRSGESGNVSDDAFIAGAGGGDVEALRPAVSAVSSEPAEPLLEVPEPLRDEFDVVRYNRMLRYEPYTAVLERFFRKGSVPDYLLRLFEKIDVNYRLSGEVINVLLHYLYVRKESWSTNYIEMIVSNLLAKQIDTFERAVAYFREESARRAQAGIGEKERKEPKTRKTSSGRKPKLAVVDPAQLGEQPDLSEEERERIRRLALKRDGKLVE